MLTKYKIILEMAQNILVIIFAVDLNSPYTLYSDIQRYC